MSESPALSIVVAYNRRIIGTSSQKSPGKQKKQEGSLDQGDLSEQESHRVLQIAIKNQNQGPFLKSHTWEDRFFTYVRTNT